LGRRKEGKSCGLQVKLCDLLTARAIPERSWDMNTLTKRHYIKYFLRTPLGLLLFCVQVPLEYHPGPVLGGFPDWSDSDWSVLTGSVGGRLNQARCIGIPVNMSLCHGISYDQMRLPNLLDHNTVHEATQQAARCVRTVVYLFCAFCPVPSLLLL